MPKIENLGVEENHRKVKQFDFRKKGVNLSFSLSIDDKDQMETFLDLMKIAEKEVKNTIKEL